VTLIEMGMVMMLMVQLSFSLASTSIENPFLMDHFKSDVINTQVLAMAYARSTHLPQHWGLDVRFNANGNINEPIHQTLGHRDIIIRLGTGRFEDARLNDD
jgi:hypothetical protein